MRGGLAIDAMLLYAGSEKEELLAPMGRARRSKAGVGRKRDRHESNAPMFVIQQTRTRLPRPMPELDHYPVPLARVLRRCAANNRIYSASEAFGGNAVLVAPALTSSSLHELTDIIDAPHSLTLGQIYTLADADTFVGSILAFEPNGAVACTSVPQIAELMCGGLRTGLYAAVALPPASNRPLAPEALADRFCRVVRSSER